MRPLAEECSRHTGVLETLHTKPSIQGQINELTRAVEAAGRPPMTLIGHSWGAWLSVIYAAKHPYHVAKLILIASAPFAPEYAENVGAIRLSRMSDDEREEFIQLERVMDDHEAAGKNDAFRRLAQLIGKADTYEFFDDAQAAISGIDYRVDVFQSVWPEARRVRQTGQLLEYLMRVACPIVAIHGDYDPHPAAGVRNTLNALPITFRFVLLTKCGHAPWRERHARDQFYRILREELAP